MACNHMPSQCNVPDSLPCRCKTEPVQYPTEDAYMRACRALHWRTAELRAHGIEPLALPDDAPHYPPDNFDFKAPHPFHEPCGHTEPESDYRDPDTGKHRTARCEGKRGLVIRGNGVDAVTDGHMWMGGRRCPNA